jgi:hypothetical protein
VTAVLTYQRVWEVLKDGDWHTMDELRSVCRFPERWLEEFRKDGLQVVEDLDHGKVALLHAAV